MISRAQELCRQLKPVLGKKIDRLWSVYIAESDPAGKRDIEQTLELLAAKHLKKTYDQDRNPFPPPDKEFARSGDIELGMVTYADKQMYPFNLKSRRLKEHAIITGRSGSGKSNTILVLTEKIIKNGIKILALDWKRGYRDLMSRHKDLQVYTIGRDVSPFRFNPLIPPQGCEPQLWIKLIVDVIASSYLGGEGVISLLVAGLDHLYREAGVFEKSQTHWPTIQDLLAWLRTAKLKGRAAMWQASAERILLAMTYGEFGAVLNTQNNSHVAYLLKHNVVLEMDGLSSSSDRVMFSEALTLYLYRYRLAKGPQQKLTNMIILEEAHNLLLKKSSESRESILETSIRMIRQYGIGYIFVDQSASLLSKVAFANSFATIALSQKLRSDVQTVAGAMNLTDEQKQALNTLAVGTAVIRLADEHTQAFLVKIPLSPIREGCVSDEMIRARFGRNSADSGLNKSLQDNRQAISPVLAADKKNENKQNNSNIENNTHPPSPKESEDINKESSDPVTNLPYKELNREEIRFLYDVVARPLSATVSRYQRLNLSRRKGNAIKHSLASCGIIEAVTIATRSGQVVLYQLSEMGRSLCSSVGIDPGSCPRESLEHRYWAGKTRQYFEKKGYQVTQEHQIKGNGAVDLLAERPGEKIAVEVETGKSDIKANLEKIKKADFDKILLIATSPDAITACRKALEAVKLPKSVPAELQNWLDIS